MRKRLLLLFFAVGLSAAGSIRAQQPAKTSSPGDDSNIKPCVVVYGAVKSPARFELRRRIRLAEALVAVGGITDRAASTVKIIKSGATCFQDKRIDQVKTSNSASEQPAVVNIADIPRGDQKSNPYLEAGDIVIVTELDPIYVAGSVVNPRAIYSKERLTLTQAIKLAGGVTSDPNTSKVVIYRLKKDPKESISITVDFWAITKHSAEDPTLQPFDIVNVGAERLMPGISQPLFDSRPLIPRGYRVIH